MMCRCIARPAIGRTREPIVGESTGTSMGVSRSKEHQKPDVKMESNFLIRLASPRDLVKP